MLALCLFACSSCNFKSDNYEKIADKITINTAKKLRNEFGLILVGIGGQMMNDIQMMSMEFNFYNVIDTEVIRKLLIKSVQEYLFTINSNEEIRPYLHNYLLLLKMWI
jgi:hypothetical protein